MNTDVMFSSASQAGKDGSRGSDEWETPPELFAKLDQEFHHFSLDVAASDANHKCPMYFDGKMDLSNGLLAPWEGRTCWMNPPYGRSIGKWMAKAWLESAGGGATVVCLVPARTDTKWWKQYVRETGAEVRFLDGRLKFGKPTVKHKMRCSGCAAVRWVEDPNKETAGCCDFFSTGKSKVTHDSAPFPSAIVIFRPSRDANGAVPSL